jgi:phage shock protein A
MAPVRLLPLLLLLGALPAAAGTVEDRASALSRAETQEADLAGRMAGLSRDLEGVARRIEALKARDRQASVLPDRELTELLQRSQQLADALSALGREREQVESRRRGAASGLAEACDAELEKLRARVDAGDAAAVDRFQQLDVLRVRAHGLLSRSLRAAPAPAPGAPESDDPADLRERADMLRDQRDRVQGRLSELDGRITELRDRDRLERAMGSFHREGLLFDDASRVQHVRSSLPSGVHAVPEAAPRAAAAGSDGSGDPASFAPSSKQADAVPPTEGAQVPPPAPAAAAPTPAAAVSTIPRFGGDPRAAAGFLGPLSGRESLADLEAARAALQREAAELEHRAADLEQRARRLEQPE